MRTSSIDRQGHGGTLSGGHLADRLRLRLRARRCCPFFAPKFDLCYTLTAVLMLAVLVSSSLAAAAVRALVGPARRALAAARRASRSPAIGIGLAAVAPSYGARRAPVLCRRYRDRRVPSRGREVRGVRERPQARERDVATSTSAATPATRSDRSSSRRSCSGSGSAAGLLAMVPVLASPRCRALQCCPYLARVGPGRDGARRAVGEDDVRAMSLLGVVIGLRSVAWFGLLTFVPLWVVAHGGTEAEGNRDALADARLRRGRHAAARPRRRSVRAAAHAARRRRRC